jgi:hypothetical protein
MGISDRQQIEEIAEKVMERMEQRTLPGMEGLISSPRNKSKRLPGVAEIQSLVQEILNNSSSRAAPPKDDENTNFYPTITTVKGRKEERIQKRRIDLR